MYFVLSIGLQKGEKIVRDLFVNISSKRKSDVRASVTTSRVRRFLPVYCKYIEIYNAPVRMLVSFTLCLTKYSISLWLTAVSAVNVSVHVYMDSFTPWDLNCKNYGWYELVSYAKIGGVINLDSSVLRWCPYAQQGHVTSTSLIAFFKFFLICLLNSDVWDVIACILSYILLVISILYMVHCKYWLV